MRVLPSWCLIGIPLCACPTASLVAQDPGAGVALDSVVVDTTLAAGDSVLIALRRHDLYRLAIWTEARSFVIRHADRAGSITPIEVPSPAADRRLYEYVPSRGGTYVLTVSDRARVAVYAATREARRAVQSAYLFDLGLVVGEYRPTTDLLTSSAGNLRHDHAAAVGLRFTTRQRYGRLGGEAAVYRVRSRVSLAGTPLQTTTSYFTDVRFLYYLTPPEGHFEAAIGGGVGIVWRVADDFLPYKVGASSLSGSVAGRIRVPLAGAIGLLLSAEDHLYRLRDDEDPTTTSPTQNDVVFGLGATVRF